MRRITTVTVTVTVTIMRIRTVILIILKITNTNTNYNKNGKHTVPGQSFEGFLQRKPNKYSDAANKDKQDTPQGAK